MVRLISSPEHASGAIYNLFRQFSWHRVSWLYHNHNENTGRGNAGCTFIMGAIQTHFSNNVAKQTSFDENESTRANYREMLIQVQKVSRSEFNRCISVLNHFKRENTHLIVFSLNVSY